MTLAAVAEGYNMLEKNGMDLKVMQKLTETSSSGSFTTQKYAPAPGLVEGAPSNRGYDGGFATTDMLKDVKLATAAAEKVGARMATGEAVSEMFEKVVAQGHGRKDFSVIFELLGGKLK